MPILYGLLGLLILVVFLILLVLFVPVYARVAYDGELRVRVRVLGIPITLLPVEDAPKKDEPQKQEQASKSKPSKVRELKSTLTSAFREDGIGATLGYLGELARLAGKAVGDVLHSMTVDMLRLDLLIAAADAQSAAVLYGQVCSVVYPALTAIETKLKIHRRAIRIEPNFLSEKSDVYMDVRLHIWVYRLVGVALALLMRYWTMKEKTNDNKEELNYGSK